MRKIKKIIIWSILVCILFTGKIVYAGEFKIKPDSTISGHYGSTNNCQYYSDFCFTGSGLRFSIYYYDYDTDKEKTTKEGASYDLWSTKHSSSWSGAVYPSNSTTWKGAHYSSLGKSNDTIAIRRTRGNTWYDNGTDFEYGNDWHGPKLSSLKAKKASFNKDFNGYINSGTVMATNDFGPYWNGSTSTTALVSFINEYLANKIKDVNGVNTFFKTNIDSSKVDKYYIVIEPIYAILTQAGINGKKKHVYVGTASELSEIYNYTFYANPLKSTKKTNKDFVANILTSIPIGSSELNTKKVINKKAYGIGVFKLSEFMRKTCLSECSQSGVKNKYLCAMSFCDESSNRKNCVDACIGTTDFTCSTPTASKHLANTNCKDETEGEAVSCTPGQTNSTVLKRIYYYTGCTETNTITYKDSLPTTIDPGTGFTYNLKLSGNKKCTTKFDVNKFNYDYAVASDTERQDMEKLFEQYQKMTKLTDDKYKYDLNDSKFTIKITEVINNKQEDNSYTLQKIKDVDGNNSIKKADKMEDEGTYYTVSSAEDYTSASAEKVVMRPKAGKYNKSYKNYSYISDMSAEYALPGICIKTGGAKKELAHYNDATHRYECDSTVEGPYREYFTNHKSKSGENATIVTATQVGSITTNVENTCNYKVGENLKCAVVENNDDGYYYLKIKSNHRLNYSKLKYIFSVNHKSTDYKTFEASADNVIAKIPISSVGTGKTLYGKIIDTETNKESDWCSRGTNKSTCKTLYKPTQYTEIKNYCQNHYFEDTANYDSTDSCESDCMGRTCKTYNCDLGKIKEYCNSAYSGETDVAACINDCSCKTQAMYRPIDLITPFPNRNPRGNWIGFKEAVKYSEEKSPEYVIRLDAETMEKINESTKKANKPDQKINAYTDYFWLEGADETQAYKSNFIHKEFATAFCIKQGEGSCD